MGYLVDTLNQSFQTAQTYAAENYPAGGGVPVSPTESPTEDTTGGGDEPTNFSQIPGSAYDYGKYFIADALDINVTVAGSYVNTWGNQFYDTWGRWPTVNDFWSDPGFLAGAGRIPTMAHILPSYFWVVDAEGNRVFYDNTSGLGPVPVANPPNLYGDLMTALATGGTPNISQYQYPTLTQDMLASVLQLGTYGTRGGGGGGGGGGGTRGLVLDRNSVIESITNQWRSLLLEEPADAEALADGYINEAKNFYLQGGQLDLQTWTLNKLRETDRYNLLYSKRPESMSEQEYLNQYLGVVSQLGLPERVARRETEAGLTSGTGQAGFAERVQGIREVRANNLGQFTQRYANAIRQMGTGVLQ